MAPPEGLEPATYRVETCCSIQLSYGGTASILSGLPACQVYKTGSISNQELLNF